MTSKRPAPTILKVLVFFVLPLIFTKQTLAVEYQSCGISQTCSIGEFLYDDNYAPIATATCNITSRYPDGTMFINSATMSAATNGWYSYTINTGTTEGVYPTQICCNAGPDYLCLDKTFKVKADVVPASTASGITAAEVWNYPDRSLTSFGTLVSDIWNYSSRSLTNFGNLVSDMWSNNSRTLTSTNTTTITQVANSADITEIKRVVKENRVLLEQLINKPIVKNYIDDSKNINLTDKLTSTQNAAANLYSNIQNLKSRSLNLSEKWDSLSETEIKSELTTLSSILKQDTNQKDTNILATTTWLKTSWESDILTQLSDHAQASKSQIDNILNNINLFGKSTDKNLFNPIVAHVQTMDTLVGSSLATSEDQNLYGFIKRVSDQITNFNRQTEEGVQLLTEIKKDPKQDRSDSISSFASKVMSSNKIAKTDSFFNKSIKNTNTPTNKVLGLMAIINTNRLILAGNSGDTINNMWLEEGSIIFRSVATNPSRSITQKVAIKYYLPTEIKKEQIISHDNELKIDYDPVENALFASGEVSLAPEETKTFLVEVEDIWNFKQEEIDSLKGQVNELVSVLKNTSYFAQATSIKSDINVTLDKIILRQQQAITPENRIKTYRESSLEMNGIEEKINSLKDLVLQSNTTGNFFGFIGGIQTVSLWGIIIVIVAGFVFLSMYLNAIRSENILKKEEIKADTKQSPEITSTHTVKNYRHRERNNHLGHKIAKIAVIALLTSGVSSVGISLTAKMIRQKSESKEKINSSVVLGSSTTKKLPFISNIKIPENGSIPVRSAPAITSPEVSTLKKDQTIFVFKIVDNWVKIGLNDKDQNREWWINEDYLDK